MVPPDSIITGIKLWKFFSRFEPAETNVVELMKECGVTFEDVQRQVKVFYEKGLTSPYRDTQYPPYLVVDKMKKQYQEEVRGLLSPMEIWLRGKEPAPEIHSQEAVQAEQVRQA